MRSIQLLNPLPVALHHYGCEMTAVLHAARPNLRIDSPTLTGIERSGLGKSARGAVEVLRQVSRIDRAGPVLALSFWPTFGNYEPSLWALLTRNGSRSAIIYHDPIPLRHQWGGGKLGQRIAGVLPPTRKPRLLVHSQFAYEALRATFPNSEVLIAPHPVLLEITPEVTQTERSQDTVVVCGQYKPARDLSILANLGTELRREGFRPVIYGRGWPQIPGWDYMAGFLSEPALDDAINGAACVLLPYIYYYQSGIAIRSLECGTPVVGASHPFLSAVFGQSWGGYVHEPTQARSWVEAITHAVALQRKVRNLHSYYAGTVVQLWSEMLARCDV